MKYKYIFISESMSLDSADSNKRMHPKNGHRNLYTKKWASKNWLANYAKEKGVWGQILYIGACVFVFSFCCISRMWKWWWWVEGRVDSLPFKLQEPSSDAATCNLPIYLHSLDKTVESTRFNVCKSSSFTNHKFLLKLLFKGATY